MHAYRTLTPLLGLAALGLAVGGQAQSTVPTPPAGTSNVFSATDTVTAVGNMPNGSNGEGPQQAVDGSTATKYLNFQQLNSGFIDTPKFGAATGTVVTALQFATANDAPERDPLTFTLSGSNNGGTTFTQIASGGTGLATDPGRQRYGSVFTFTNAAAYKTYQIIFPTIRDANATSVQISEVALFGALPTPEPSQAAVLGFGALGLCGLGLRARRRRAA